MCKKTPGPGTFEGQELAASWLYIARASLLYGA